MKQTIKIKESELRQIISESVKKLLKESMTIDKNDVDVLCTFKCRGRKYSLVHEKFSEDDWGCGYWVVDECSEPVSCRFFDRNIRWAKLESPIEYVKSDNFDYGLFSDLVVVDEPSIYDDDEARFGKTSSAYNHELGVAQDRGAWAEDAGIYGWDLDS